MNSQNFTSLLRDAQDAFKNKTFQPEVVKSKVVKSKMTSLAVKNKEDLAAKNLPDYLRTPTAEELIEMRQYAIDLKKNNPSWSKRQIRKDVQQKFHIKIFR